MRRWWIAGCGTVLQLCLGSVYAWSYFQKPLVAGYGWSHTQVAWTFSLAILSLGLAAAAGGLLLPRVGPRSLAVAGSLLYAAGYLLAALALHWKLLPLLWLGYGVVGGIGLGLGYVTPVATVAKWFPDRKGLVTGMVVMGFGLGALLMSKVIAPLLPAHLPAAFAGNGGIVGVVGLLAALGLRNPPAASVDAATVVPVGIGALWLREWGVLWLVFFCNIAAGIAIISFQSPLFQQLWRGADPVAAGATLIGVSSLFNGVGRLFWGGLSDRWGSLCVFRGILATQLVAFAVLMRTTNPWVFGALICYVLLCYGGGFGVMPALILQRFGAARMAVCYGGILTAWSAAGVVGPQTIAWLQDRYGAAAASYAFAGASILMMAGLLLTVLRPSSQAPVVEISTTFSGVARRSGGMAIGMARRSTSSNPSASLPR